MSKTKAGGTTKNVRDSAGKRLGVKVTGGDAVINGNIIIRQRGTRMEAGEGTKVGVDHTIYATRSGRVSFTQKQITKFTGQKVRRTIVNVVD